MFFLSGKHWRGIAFRRSKLKPAFTEITKTSIFHRLSFIEHTGHISRHTFMLLMCTDIFCDSWQSRVIKKEMSSSQADVHCEHLFELFNIFVDISFFSLSLYIYIHSLLAVTNKTDIRLSNSTGRLFILNSNYIFRKMYQTLHQTLYCFLQLYFYLSMSFHLLCIMVRLIRF